MHALYGDNYTEDQKYKKDLKENKEIGHLPEKTKTKTEYHKNVHSINIYQPINVMCIQYKSQRDFFPYNLPNLF